MNWYKTALAGSLRDYFDSNKARFGKYDMGFWITDKGVFVDLDNYTTAHADTVLRYLEENDKEAFDNFMYVLSKYDWFDANKDIYQDYDEWDISREAMNLGWIKGSVYESERLGTVLDVDSFNPTPQVISKLLSVAKFVQPDAMYANGVLSPNFVELRNNLKR